MKDLNSSISDAILAIVVKYVVAALVSWLPFLGIPGINLIVVYIVNTIGKLIFDQLGKFIDFTMIDFKVDAENQAYKAAIDKLKALPENASEADIAKAKADFTDTLSKLVRLN